MAGCLEQCEDSSAQVKKTHWQLLEKHYDSCSIRVVDCSIRVVDCSIRVFRLLVYQKYNLNPS